MDSVIQHLNIQGWFISVLSYFMMSDEKPTLLFNVIGLETFAIQVVEFDNHGLLVEGVRGGGGELGPHA